MKKFLLPFMAVLMSLTVSSCNNAPATTVQTVSETDVVINNIMSRRSIRKYTDQAIPEDVLNKIIECGINAPNGMNQQCYEVKVVTDPESCTFLSEKLQGLYKAPAYMFIAAWNGYDMSKIDCGLLSENVCLSAWAYGVGTINLGFPVRSLKEQPEILEKFGFGEEYEIALVLALGYPDEAPDARPRNAEKVQFVTVK